MSDWEAEETSASNVAVTESWEDEATGDAPDSWDAEEPVETKPAAPEPKPKAAAPAKPAAKAPVKAAAAGKKTAATAASTRSNPIEEFEDLMSIREREKRQVERSDFENAQDLFAGVRSAGDPSAISLDTYQPKTIADFNAYAEVVSKKFKTMQKDSNYLAFIKQVLRLSTTEMRSDDLSELAATLNALFNERQKKEKESKGKKAKPTSNKPSVNVRPDLFEDGEDDFYDDEDDY
eukprot:TRINITY_DN646_c0_g1_i1.p1 TRINITY_DN646_c0_g1~~TRINITY_DN646_c0_g1_i1.p1  ORF type:complete len:235 (+),score=68.86 TRINITY_DN646_c0_g1_i1:86-790(+)